MVGNQGHGFIRKITAVSANDGTVNVSTTPAQLNEAVERGYFQLNPTLSFGSGQISSAKDASGSVFSSNDVTTQAGGVSVTAAGLTLTNVTLKSEVCTNGITCVNLTVKIPSGTISFDPSLDIGGNVSTRSFHAIASGAFDANATAQVTISGEAKPEFKQSLFSVSKTSVAFIGHVPVVVVTELSLVASVTGSVDAAMTASTGFTSNGAVTVGSRHENGAWTVVASGSRTFVGQPVVGSAGNTFALKFALKPELKIFLYGIAGPFMAIDPYAKLEATFATDRTVTERGVYGLDAEIGAKVEVLNIKTTDSWRQPLIEEREFYRKVTTDPGPSAPAAPTNLSATPAIGRVSLEWSDNSGDETGFRIERASSGGGSAFSEIGVTAPSVVSFIDQTVIAGASYTYRIRAFNSVGNSPYSNTVSTTVPSPAVTVSLTANPETIVAGQSSTLSWSAMGATSCSAAWTTSSAVSGSQLVSPAITSTYSITCSGAGGNGSAQTVITVGTQPIPATPTNLAAVPSGTTVSLAWSDNSSNELGFRVERANGTSGSFAEIAVTATDIAAYLDPNLSAGSIYSYRVRAYNGSGNSSYSNTVTVTTPSTGACQAPIVVESSVQSPTIWSPGQSGCVHYLVKGAVIVWEGLTVQPGTVVNFAANATLLIRGSLTAVGTAALPIKFLGEQQIRGYWQGIEFDSNSAANELTYVEVAHAGGAVDANPANVTVGAFDRLKLTNSILRESKGWGLYAGEDSDLSGFSTNVLRNNAQAGIRLGAEQLGYLDLASDYVTANGKNYLDVYATSIHFAQTWRITSAPIHFTGSSIAWQALTISPGMTFLFGSDARLLIRGSLTAVGTAALPIKFLGEQQVRGYWHGIEFDSNSAANELTYVEVAHAGGAVDANPANVTVGAFDRLKLTNSILRESKGWGLYVDPQGTITPPLSSGGNSFSNNTKGATNNP